MDGNSSIVRASSTVQVSQWSKSCTRLQPAELELAPPFYSLRASLIPRVAVSGQALPAQAA